MSAEIIQEIEISNERAQEFIARNVALERLFANTDFQHVIGKGYFEQEAVRLVHLKGDPAMQGDQHQREIIREMDGISALAGYFQTVRYQAQMAAESIADHEEFLAEMREEGEAE